VPNSQTAPATPVSPTPAGGKKALCLTFDDGPWSKNDISFRIIDLMTELKVPSVFYNNGHPEFTKKQDYVAKIQKGGHLIGNHMYSHDIMALSQYLKFYSAAPHQATCLGTPEQQALFEKNLMGNHKEWKAAGYEIKHLRFPGDGRLIQCLKDAAAAKGYSVHTPWDYELAPSKKPEARTYWFGYVQTDIGVQVPYDPAKPTGPQWYLYGDLATPKSGAVVLAHDAHYDYNDTPALGNKVNLLRAWVTKMRADGYEFALLGADGKCPKTI